MKTGQMSNRKILKQFLLIVLCVTAGWFLKTRFTPPAMMGAMGGAGEPMVLVEAVKKQDITPSQNFIGKVDAINSVSLQPQVSGYMEKVTFTEGSMVNEGDVLFVIEKQKYQATADLRKAELDSAKASLTKIEKDYHRQKSLNQQKYASEAKLDEAYSSLLQAQAAVKQAEANYSLAKIDLDHAEIKAPFSGKIGKAKVTEGNFVSSATGILASVVQVNPIRITFSVTDKQITNFLQNRSGDTHLKVRVQLPNGEVIRKTSTDEFVDNSIDTATATLAVYAEFDNSDGLLVPGSYVNLDVDSGITKNALTVSQASVGQDEHGSYVMVVNKDSLVEQRRVELGEVFGTRQIVKSGLKDGDKVIIQGLQKVSDGKKVRAEEVKTEGK
ncbi:MAG: efflux RND transporter periplasmic adaptor subunit [Alphaproteobacteria bacterium]|nr:efflux RND transporter periplasmic adaptor subunit [Alphaproteobacteria bacterium]